MPDRASPFPGSDRDHTASGLPENEVFLELERVHVWRGDQAEVAALSDVSLRFRHGESVAILGPNGSGKSTLLQLLSGGLRPEARDESYCRLFGEEQWCIDELRAKIGVVMPEEVSRFDPDELAFDVILTAFRGAYGRVRTMRFSKTERAAAERAAERLGVTHLINREFGALSSGERRRFLIARALAPDPGVLVLDEPSTALDFAAATELGEIQRELIRDGHTLILVTHHPGEIPPEIDRVVMLQKGRIFCDAPKRKLLESEQLSALFGLPLRVRWSHGWCHVRGGSGES